MLLLQAKISSMQSIKPSAYVCFLNLLDELEQVNPGKKLDPTEEQLLNHVTLANSKGKSILVGDLSSLSKFGSKTSLHGRIQNLVAKGYIKLNQDRADGRRKFVIPTAKAVKHYEYLSACLEKALKSS